MQNRKRMHGRHHKKKDSHKGKKHMGGNKKAFRGILEQSDVFEKFKRQEEDVLRYIHKQIEKKVDISKLKQVFRNINGDIELIIKDLIKETYIIQRDGQLYLTSNGEEVAELIHRIHHEIEDYIKGKNLSCNAHLMAHILEHKLTEQEIENMIRISDYKDKSVSLPNFKYPSGTIVEVNLLNCKVWTKLVSIGIFPGQKIHILNRTASNYLIEVKGSKFAIDHSLAAGIYLIP